MKTSTFVAALRAAPSLPLVFRAGSELVAPGYHLTEVKRVSYQTMDCGAEMHHWSEMQFEIWSPEAASAETERGHMPARKFLAIVDRVARDLPLDLDAPARIHTSFGQQPAALYDVASIEAVDGQLHLALNPDRTRCKARERALAGNQALGCGCGEPTEAAARAEACCSTAGAGTSSGRSMCCA